ncbi:hypothetical protein, partial [Eubacterium sp.]|uniref:hypothetical protein n=1 Tax=Eubacterium sp. TaxID=142586 RepID=UPI0030DD39C8
MAIGDTSIIKDANGVNITVKDIASDYLIEQEDGTYHRENHLTDITQIKGLAKRTETGVRPDGEAVNGARANLIEIGNHLALYTDYCEIPVSQATARTREYAIPPIIANRIDYAVSHVFVSAWQNETWGMIAG